MKTHRLAAGPALALLLAHAACGTRIDVDLESGSTGAGGAGTGGATATTAASTSASSAVGTTSSTGAGGMAPAAGAHDVVQVALGADHACALFGDHSVKCWGRNDHGQLGLGDTLDRGGAPGTMGAALPTVDLGQGRSALSLSAGNDTTCAVLDTHELKCWGNNPFGKLGLGDGADRGDAPGSMGDALPVVDLGAGARVTAVQVGNYHACALLDDGSLRCWGDGTSAGLGANHGETPGSMGDGLPAVKLGSGRTATRLAAGYNTTCAILDDGATKCWGDNTDGELGLGDELPRGASPATMGDALAALDFGAPRRAVELAPSSYSACARLDDGSVRCWGNGVDLGLGSAENHGGVPGTMGAALPAVALGTGRSAVAVSSGARWSCALLDDHQVKCWGYNQAGALGQGSAANLGDEPSEMGDHLPEIDLGAGRSVLALAAGSAFGCAILDTRELKCWGSNYYGQLGLGDLLQRGEAPATMGDHLPAVALW
jgi:alpha-tubulin suppressor-like RCC1 family protein